MVMGCDLHCMSYTWAHQAGVSFNNDLTCAPSFMIVNDFKDTSLKKKGQPTMQYTQYVKASAVCDINATKNNNVNLNQGSDLNTNENSVYDVVDFKFQTGIDVSGGTNIGGCAYWNLGGGLDYQFVNTEKKEFNHAVGAKVSADAVIFATSNLKAIVSAGAKATCSVDGKSLDTGLFNCVKTKYDKIGYTYGGSAALEFFDIANVKFSVFAVQGENGKHVPAGQVSLTLGFNKDRGR